MPEATIKISNLIVNSRYHYTLYEKRVMSKINEVLNEFDTSNLSDDEQMLYVSMQSGAAISTRKGVRIRLPYHMVLNPGDQNYSHTKTAAFKLVNKHFKLKDDTLVPFVIGVECPPGSGYMLIDIDLRALPYFADLKRDPRVTTLNLSFALDSKSKYTVRMVELLAQFQDKGWRYQTLENLYGLLGIEKGKYKRWDAFRTKVLLTARKELADTPYAFKWEIARKDGKKIVSLNFQLLNNAGVKTAPAQLFPLLSLPLAWGQMTATLAEKLMLIIGQKESFFFHLVYGRLLNQKAPPTNPINLKQR